MKCDEIWVQHVGAAQPAKEYSNVGARCEGRNGSAHGSAGGSVLQHCNDQQSEELGR